MPGDRPKNRDRELVVGSAAAGGAAPDIPVLKKKDDEEKKGGGLVAGRGAGGGSSGNILYRWLGIGGESGGALSAAGRAAVGVGAGASAGLAPGLLSFVSSNAGLALLTAALSALAVYGLYSFGSSGEGARSRASVFPVPEAQQASASASAVKTEAAGSLNFFADANKGALGQEENAAAKETDAPAGPAKADAKGDKAPPPAKPAAGAPAAAKSKLLAGAGFGGSRTPLGSGNGLAGGSGMAGGLNNKFSPKASRPLLDFNKALTSKSGLSRRAMSSASPSRALDQLRFTQSTSQKARASNIADAASANATNAFDGTPGQTANLPLSGIGYGDDSSKNINPNADGGPIQSAPTLGETTPPPTGQSGDVSPWTGALMMGVTLLATASTIILIEGVVAAIAKIIIPLMPIAMMLAALAGALAASASAIGTMIMTQYGQPQQGLVLVIGGAITSAAAIAALVSPPDTAPIELVLGGIAGLVASMLAMITGMAGHKVH